MFFQKISYLFRKSVLFRLGTFCVIILLAAGIIWFITAQSRHQPRINTIDPSVGMPGDVLIINGKHFGTEQRDSYIEIQDIRLTASSYLEWSDTEIMAVLPPNVKNGLIYVVTAYGKSAPGIFANKSTIPVPVNYDPETERAVIQDIKEKKISIGSVVTVTGKNFGATRNGSKVFFSWQGDGSGNSGTINRIPGTSEESDRFTACSDSAFEYEFWSDTEVRIRVPDGAVTGNMYISTEKGQSNPFYIEITDRPGVKTYHDKKTYVVSLAVNIADTTANGESTLFIRVPRPPVTASQREVIVSASQPVPILSDYMNVILHQFENPANGKKIGISHTIAVSSYGVETQIQPKLVKAYDKNSPVYAAYTKPDALIRSDSAEIKDLIPSITGKEKNQWLQAQAIYQWLLKNIELLPAPRDGGADALSAIADRKGDAYDMAILFTEFARAAGIPAVPVSGILVDKNQTARVHWWAEFYIEQFGWVPVDPGLGAGLEYIPFKEIDNPAEFYFGNLDGQHIILSRGWNAQKPMTPKSRTVYRPRSYAYQSIWEESSDNLRQYSSFWEDPRIIGVY